MPVTLTDLVGIECSASGTGERANRCALLACGDSTNGRTTQGRSRHSQFIPMFLPESAMTTMTSSLRRGYWSYWTN